MRQIQGSKETYLLLSQVSVSSGIPYGTLYYYAVKSKTRFYKFSSRRWLEKSDVICVLNLVKPRRTELEQTTIDEYLKTLI